MAGHPQGVLLVNEAVIARPSAAAPRGVVVDNPMRKLSVFMLVMFLYIASARILEVVYIPGLAFVFAVLALIGAALGGDLAGAVKSKIGLLLIGFTIWAAVILPMSVWSGGSFAVLKDLWLKTVVVFYMIGAVLLTRRDCRTMFYTIAAATATIVVLSFKFANMSSGRLAFGYGGTLANPNDFAAYLLVGAPFCVYAFMRAGIVMRVFWTGILLLLMMQFMRTGSRGGIVALAIISLYLFWKSSMMLKGVMMVCVMAALAAAPVILPRSVIDRYATLLGSEGEPEDADSRQGEFAEASTQSRSQLLRISLKLTATKPVFGVGIGMFSVGAAESMKAEGKRGVYQQTHNLFTQVSSETGIPGFLLYMAAVWYAVGSLRFVRRHASVNPDLARMAFCLHASWILFLSTGMFSSVAYHLQAAVLLGFSYALKNVLTSEMANAPAPRRAAAPRGRIAAAQFALR